MLMICTMHYYWNVNAQNLSVFGGRLTEHKNQQARAFRKTKH
jgi:hypothetical protein